jgi:Holliday junction resolvase RusA-like endonuclease
VDTGIRVKTLILNIVPRPAARPRFFRGRVHTEPKYKAWQQECIQLIRQQWKDDPLQHVEHIEYIFVGANRRCDIDNLVKSITDCMTYGKILRGDNLAVLDSISATYHHAKEIEPCIILKIFY